MGARPKIFHNRFARASPVFVDHGPCVVVGVSRPEYFLFKSIGTWGKERHTRAAVWAPKSVEGRNAGLKPGAYTGAQTSAYIRLLGFLLLCFAPSFAFAAEGSGTANTNVKRQAASAQFARAEEQRAALNEK